VRDLPAVAEDSARCLVLNKFDLDVDANAVQCWMQVLNSGNNNLEIK
jgi:hypothetical protein